MLLTPRLCLERQWEASLGCPGCRVSRMYGRFPDVPARLLDTPVAVLFAEGRFVCRKCGDRATHLSIFEWNVGRRVEIAAWPAPI